MKLKIDAWRAPKPTVALTVSCNKVVTEQTNEEETSLEF